jgi:hypothetical protein
MSVFGGKAEIAGKFDPHERTQAESRLVATIT